MTETSPWVLWIFIVFFIHFGALNLGYLVLLVIGIADNWRRARELRSTDMDQLATSPLTIPVSVVVPAYNEGETILTTVESILASRFPEFEVIVVDDGSTDSTLELLRHRWDLVDQPMPTETDLDTTAERGTFRSRRDARLRVISQENGGKARALNAGIAAARYRYVVNTDGDGLFAPDALLRMIRPINFDPGRIIGLGVTMRALNSYTVSDARITGFSMAPEWLVRFQMLEYSTVFLANRLGWSALNAVPIVSGGGGIWRRDVLLELGGMSSDLTHEDLDVTLRAHQHFRRGRRPYRIVYLPDPVVWTEVPHTWRGLYLQRKRWQRTVYESIWRQRKMWFNPRYGTVGMLQMPYLILYEAVGPFIELAAYALTIALFVFGLADPVLVASFLVFAAGLTSLVRLASLTADAVFYRDYGVRDVLTLSVAAAFEFWLYRPFLLTARIPAFFEFLRGHRGHERAERMTGSE